MPELPQFPLFTARQREGVQIVGRPTTTDDLVTWLNSFESAIQRLWTSLVFVVNALSRTDTAANKPTTPELNDILFTETDTNQTYVAVAGAWKSLGGQRDSRVFSFFCS